jgi:hypothetical protein
LSFFCAGEKNQTNPKNIFPKEGPIFFSDFSNVIVGADDFLRIELNFLPIYKGTFRSFFPNGGKKTKSQTASQLFFWFFQKSKKFKAERKSRVFVTTK